MTIPSRSEVGQIGSLGLYPGRGERAQRDGDGVGEVQRGANAGCRDSDEPIADAPVGLCQACRFRAEKDGDRAAGPNLLHDPPARSEDGTGVSPGRRADDDFRVGRGFFNALEYACAIEDGLGMIGNRPGLVALRVRSRRDEPQVPNAEVVADPGDGPDISRPRRTNQDDDEPSRAGPFRTIYGFVSDFGLTSAGGVAAGGAPGSGPGSAGAIFTRSEGVDSIFTSESLSFPLLAVSTDNRPRSSVTPSPVTSIVTVVSSSAFPFDTFNSYLPGISVIANEKSPKGVASVLPTRFSPDISLTAEPPAAVGFTIFTSTGCAQRGEELIRIAATSSPASTTHPPKRDFRLMFSSSPPGRTVRPLTPPWIISRSPRKINEIEMRPPAPAERP